MSAATQAYKTTLEQICSQTIANNAAKVDRDGTFPNESIQALKTAGLLGAMSAPEVGGLGLGLSGASTIVRRVAEDCGSTAMVLCMHYCGTAVLEKHAVCEIRRAAATGVHLSTLAFSEAGSRSHFWVPAGTASSNGEGGAVVLNAAKSWVTLASHATAYVWSSRPLEAEGLSTLWLVPAGATGISVQGPFDGLGLRGNDSSPVCANDVRVSRPAMLGGDGQGFDIMMNTVLPVFVVLSASCSLGFMEAAIRTTTEHAARTRHADTRASLADLPVIRSYIARMQLETDMARTLLDDTIAAIGEQRTNVLLRILECKAAADEAAAKVLDVAMRVCGGAAFRKEVGVERRFRDARAACVMAPTTDVLYDFIGKYACGLPLF